jgi:hypothetical protein
VGDIILIHPPLKVRSGKKFDHIRKRGNALISPFDKGGPVANMLFRPEEVHGASGIARIFKPFPEGHGDIGLVPSCFLLIHDDTIPDLNTERLTTVQAGRIYDHFFAGEKPADRQRFKGSLAEPFLLTFNGDAVLGGQIVERGKGNDVIGSRVKPSRYAGGEKIVKGFSAFFH